MTRIQVRRDTSANWASVNPTPAEGEPCFETDTGKLKIGNGQQPYNSLPYIGSNGGSTGYGNVEVNNIPVISKFEDYTEEQ